MGITSAFLLGFSLLELYTLVKVGSSIGAFTTVLWCIISALWGIQIARMQGAKTFLSAFKTLSAGSLPALEMLDAFMIFLAGLFLVAPGFISDFFGIALLIPPVRHFLRDRAIAKLPNAFEQSHASRPNVYQVRIDSDHVERTSKIIDL